MTAKMLEHGGSVEAGGAARGAAGGAAGGGRVSVTFTAARSELEKAFGNSDAEAAQASDAASDFRAR